MMRELAQILALSAALLALEAAIGAWRGAQSRAGAAIGAGLVVGRLA